MSAWSTPALVCLLASAGCGSSPPSTFYALSPSDGAAVAGAPHAIKLRRPGIAGYLDRPEVVTRVANFRLGLVDTERWGSPLDEMLGRVLAQDLQQRLPGCSVFTEDGAISADADRTVEVDVRRFELDEHGRLVLVAEVAMEKDDSHAPAGTRAVSLSLTPAASTTTALVAAMSELLGRLADQIVALVRAG